MANLHIDFSRYSRDELEGALLSIDREKYPDNYRALKSALGKARSLPEERAREVARKEAELHGLRLEESDCPKPWHCSVRTSPDGDRLLRCWRSWSLVMPFVFTLGFGGIVLSVIGIDMGTFGVFLPVFLLAVLLSWFARGEKTYRFSSDRLEVRGGVFTQVRLDGVMRSEIRRITLLQEDRDHSRNGKARLPHKAWQQDDANWGLIIDPGSRLLPTPEEPEACAWLGLQIARWAEADYRHKKS